MAGSNDAVEKSSVEILEEILLLKNFLDVKLPSQQNICNKLYNQN